MSEFQGVRHAYIPIATFILVEMMTEGWEGTGIKCTEGLPEDAEYVRQFYKEMSDEVCLVFSHPSFDLVERGGLIPQINATYQIAEYIKYGSTP